MHFSFPSLLPCSAAAAADEDEEHTQFMCCIIISNVYLVLDKLSRLLNNKNMCKIKGEKRR